jgi:hypothetical protein
MGITCHLPWGQSLNSPSISKPAFAGPEADNWCVQGVEWENGSLFLVAQTLAAHSTLAVRGPEWRLIGPKVTSAGARKSGFARWFCFARRPGFRIFSDASPRATYG